MNQTVRRICIVLVLVLTCVGVLSVRFARLGRAAPVGSSDNPGITPPYAKNIEIMGNYGGASHTVALDGSHAYLGNGLSMLVMDIADPTHPVPTGRVLFTEIVRDISINNGYAYVAAGDAGLRVVDIADPSAPVEVSSYLPEVDPQAGSLGPALSVEASNGYAYVTFEGGDLWVVDVSDPIHPVQTGWYTTPGSARDVALVGNYAYIADGDPGIDIIDISDPTHPALISNYDSSNFASVNSLVISGTFGYVATFNTITVLDFSDVMNPIQTASIGFIYPTQYVSLDGGYVYVTALDGVYAFQTSSSGSLVYSGFFSMPPPERIAAVGGHAYVADSFAGLRIIDISNPASMVEAGFYDEPEIFHDMTVAGNYAYAISETWEMWVLDISDPRWPIETGYLVVQASGFLEEIGVAGNYAYITDDDYGLWIIDISDPANPVQISQLPLSGGPIGIAVAGSYVYIATWTEGVRVVDISDPLHPVEVGSYFPGEGGNCIDIAVRGNYVYVADMVELLILDVSDPTQPTKAGSYGMPATRIFISNQIAYVRAYFGGYLYIIDISDPANPALLSGYYPANMVYDVAIIGNSAYITNASKANKQYGAAVVDVSDPTQPIEVGSYRNPKLSPSTFVVPVGEFVYLFTNGIYTNGDESGVLILHFTGLSLDGEVLQTNRLPASGVTLSITSALTTTTILSGDYTFGELGRGTYTVTPSLPGFTFWPASHSLTLPPNGVHQDFTILPLPVSITLTPGFTSTLTLTDTQGLTTVLVFPAGAVTETMTLTLTPAVGSDGGAWVFTGHAFELAAYHEGALLPGFTFSMPVTVTIHFSNGDVRLVNDKSQLALWEWAGGAWQDAVQICEPEAGYQRDEAGNALSLAICRVGRFKLMGPTAPVFLPVVSAP